MNAIVYCMQDNAPGRRLARLANDLPAIGRRLVAARRAAGLRPIDVALRAHIGRNTLANWEMGLKRPSVDQLALLLPVLDVSLDYVYFGDMSRLPWELKHRIEVELAALAEEPQQKAS